MLYPLSYGGSCCVVPGQWRFRELLLVDPPVVVPLACHKQWHEAVTSGQSWHVGQRCPTPLSRPGLRPSRSSAAAVRTESSRSARMSRSSG